MKNNTQPALKERIKKALDDFTKGRASMHVPPLDTDVDMVLAECSDRLSELEASCAALAAENAKLSDCANFYRLGFKPVKGAFGIEYRPTEQLLDDCGNTAIEAIKTPATDAFMAEVRAQGVEMFATKTAEDLRTAGGAWGVIQEPYHEIADYLEDRGESFAAQLRKGVQS